MVDLGFMEEFLYCVRAPSVLNVKSGSKDAAEGRGAVHSLPQIPQPHHDSKSGDPIICSLEFVWEES